MKMKMRNFIKNIFIIGAMLTALTGYADEKGRLYIIGDETPYGWDLDKAQALLSTAENPSVFTGTIYLKTGKNNEGRDYTFKFMEAPEWGGTEFGLPSDVESTIVSGDIPQLASGTLDVGYKQMSVAETGNYYITVDTENLTANIKRSEYQGSEIIYTSLFLVGSATPHDWDVSKSTPLYQSEQNPYEYKATVTLKAKDVNNPENPNGPTLFKIVTSLRGAGNGSWDPQYFFFRDAEDPGKISTDSTDDRQWSVDKDGEYIVTVNTLDKTISIEYLDPSGINDIEINASEKGTPVYYNLMGCRVNNPSNGVFIKVTGKKVEKVMLH